MKIKPTLIILVLAGCGLRSPSEKAAMPANSGGTIDYEPQIKELVHDSGEYVGTRFIPPRGFSRPEQSEESFGYYLRWLPLKPAGAEVLYYNGGKKPNRGVYAAVVDLPIGKKDLHQCADAVMRLRADYLYAQGRYEDIHFNFTNGFTVNYSEWMKGKRIAVEGNRTWWIQQAEASNTKAVFWEYLETIFMYAGTLSLDKELVPVSISDTQPGDVFIQGGSPGHAVVIVDMAEDTLSGRKVFLLGQSYMPAQEIQILANPGNAKISPWYNLEYGEELITPEWRFSAGHLKRFPE